MRRTTEPLLVLFGDGAGAVIVEASEEQGVISTHIHADGKYKDLLGAEAPQRGRPATVDEAYLYMKGNEVFKVAVTKLADIVTETLQANDMDASENRLGWYLTQANLRINHRNRQKAAYGYGQSCRYPGQAWQYFCGHHSYCP